MAAIMPNTPGTGNNIPISKYVAGITESYPNVNRQRTVESSINSKETIDFLPTNIGSNPQAPGEEEISLPHSRAIFSKLKNEDKDLFSFRNCKK